MVVVEVLPFFELVVEQLGVVDDHPVEEAVELALEADSHKPRFNGTINGWRVADLGTLKAEMGTHIRNLALDCPPTLVSSSTATGLDFTLTYLPAGTSITRVGGEDKWMCGTKSLSVAYDYSLSTPNGPGSLWVMREVVGRRAVDLDAPYDHVEPGVINGHPAILARPSDHATGLGGSQVIVIEDDSPPEYTILRLDSEHGVPFAELIKIAEGAK